MSATKVKKTAWAWECSSGSFWDPMIGAAAGPVHLTILVGQRTPSMAQTPVPPGNETRNAVLLTFNGCPKPDAETMKLKGKRLPASHSSTSLGAGIRASLQAAATPAR